MLILFDQGLGGVKVKNGEGGRSDIMWLELTSFIGSVLVLISAAYYDVDLTIVLLTV